MTRRRAQEDRGEEAMAINFEELKQLDPRDPGRWPLPVRLGVIALFFVVVTALLL